MKPNSRNKRTNSQKGSAAIEFALLGTLFVTLLAGAMDWARIFYMQIEVANAASAGVQYGMQNSAHWTDYSGMQTAATNDAPNVSGITATASQLCTNSDNNTVTCGTNDAKHTYIQVVTNATFTTMGTYPMIPNSVPLSGKAVMRVE